MEIGFVDEREVSLAAAGRYGLVHAASQLAKERDARANSHPTLLHTSLTVFGIGRGTSCLFNTSNPTFFKVLEYLDFSADAVAGSAGIF